MADKPMDGMVSMKRPKEDMHQKMAHEMSEHQYGWGLCLRLENFELDALKLTLPQPGKKFLIHAVGEVTNVHESASMEQEGDRGMSIQITHLDLENYRESGK